MSRPIPEQLRSWATNRRRHRMNDRGADLLERAADHIDELEMRNELLSPNPRQSREKPVAGR